MMTDRQISVLVETVSHLGESVSQLSESVSQLAQITTNNQGDIGGLTTALDLVVTEFVRPTAKQALENQQAIAALTQRAESHQEWLDEDRQDINTLRQDTSSQITALIEQANADRKAFTSRFDATQAEIRQDQRLILSQGERLDTAIEAFTSRFDAMQAEIRQNQRLIMSKGERLDAAIADNQTLLSEVLSLSRRVTAVEDAA